MPEVVARLLRGKVDSAISGIFEKLREAGSSGAGALGIFVGVVKGEVAGKRVEKLVYTAYESLAQSRLEEIARSAATKYGLDAAYIYHATGELRPGDATVVIAAIAKSRKSALAAVGEMIERVKHEVPIFKLEVREDGEYWVVGDGERVPRLRPGT